MLNFEFTPEQKALVEETRRFTRERIIPIAGQADKTHEFPLDVFKEAWELGFVGPNIPEEYGGGGQGIYELVLVCEELAAAGCPLLLLLVVAFRSAGEVVEQEHVDQDIALGVFDERK